MEPGAGVLALEGGLHVAVVLEVVAEDEGGTVVATTMAADPLAGAEGFDGDAVAENDGAGAPDGTATDGVGIAAGEIRIVDEFGFDVFEMGVGLVGGVGDDPDVRLAAFERGAQGIGERGQGGLGGAAGAEEVELGVAVDGHFAEVVGEPVVHGGGGLGEVVGEIALAPGEEGRSREPGAGNMEFGRGGVFVFADEGEAGVENELAEMGFGEAGEVGGELETLRVGIEGRIERGGLEASGESVEVEHGGVESGEPGGKLRVQSRELRARPLLTEGLNRRKQRKQRWKGGTPGV
ncbi:MAG: hypothetical protein GXY83_15970 [Rhodopirellula sp.]|nr:hypothetical protein [Rhodopirellula sp.]